MRKQYASLEQSFLVVLCLWQVCSRSLLHILRSFAARHSSCHMPYFEVYYLKKIPAMCVDLAPRTLHRRAIWWWWTQLTA
jgi:hypothetical protein